VIALIEKEGRKAIAIPGDISNEKFCRQMVEKAHKKLGGLDILACVAGKQHAVDKIADLTTTQLEQTYRVNVFALFWITKAALPLMPPGGSIITTASIQATHPSQVCWITHLRRPRYSPLQGRSRARWRRMAYV
jgi:NAD(P)-dependent dehydrogenase (short-subunit alcohol dehydrogenase family)